MSHVEHHVAHHFDSAEQEFETSKLGMWLFLVSEVLMFGGLFVAYTVFRNWYPDTWETCANILDWRLGAVNTVILIVSSFTMVLGVYGAQTDRQTLLKVNLALTILFGAMFMVNKYFEWTHEFELGVYPGKYFESDLLAEQGIDEHRANVFFGLYFTMTGIHGLHIIIGIGLLLWLLIKAQKRQFYPGYFTPVEMVGLYWHIVDLIWIFLFPLFYLI